LSNADFEAGLAGWQTWSEDSGKPADASSLDYVLTPFFSVEHNPQLIYSGTATLHVGRIYDPWHAGLQRSIRAPAGAAVRFCVHGRLYASNRDFGHEPSWSSIDGHLQVGIYPDGAADWNTSGVIWSEPINPHDEWQLTCVDTTVGQTGQITLFTSVNYRGLTAKHLDAWWDDAELSVTSSNSTAFVDNSSLTLSTNGNTQPINVLLLVPSQAVTTTAAFVVIPAQVFVSPQGLTLAVSARSNLPTTSGLLLTPAATVRATIEPTDTPTNTPAPTATPAPVSTATPTLQPTSTATAQPMSTRTLSQTSSTPIVRSTANDSPSGAGLIGVGALLVIGISGALFLVRRR
jgi:hypothetical protein